MAQELPKIVRARLDRKAGPNAEPLRGATHPDANLIWGFVERSLSQDERAAMLNHLADCAACRELIHLTFPAPDVEAAMEEARGASQAATRRPLWLTWRGLRWGVLAASVGVVLVGAFRTGVLKLPAAKHTASTTIAENQPVSRVVAPSSPATASSQVQAPPAPRPSAAPAELAERKAPGTLADALKPAPPSATTAGYRADSSKLLKQEESAVGGMAGTVGAAGGVASRGEAADLNSSMIAKAAPAKDKELLAAKQPPANLNARQLRTTTATGAPANTPPAAPESDLKKGSADRDLANKIGPVSEAVEVQAAPAGREKKADDQSAAVQGQMLGPPPESAAKQTNEERPASGLVSQSQARGAGVAMQKSTHAPAPPSAQLERRATLQAYWSVSASGKLQRSAAGSGPWTELSLDDSVKFRAVTADGHDVWAGGSGGALYHSTDRGEHWTRVRVGPNRTADETAVTDEIVSVRFTDRQHGSVTTAAHQTWVTADGGQHWAIVASRE